MVALENVEWEDCLLQPVQNPEALRVLRKKIPSVPSAAHYFLGSPWIVEALVAFDNSQLPIAHVPSSVRELIALVVSQDNSCRYCYAMTRMVLKILGMSDDRIHKLEQDLPLAEFDPMTRACIEFARLVSHANPLPDRRAAQPLFAVGFSSATVRELNLLVAVSIFYNRLLTLPAVPVEAAERMIDHWAIRLARPIIARVVRAQMRRRPTTGAPLEVEDRGGPFAAQVNALADLPLATSVNRVVDAALASPVLPRRTKAIIFGVIARGLGCCVSEQAAVRLLREDGIDANDVEKILSHFDAPCLSPEERAIAPFARDTIRYRPAQIQKRTRELRGALNNEQLVEVIGLCALGNTLCRLSVAVDMTRDANS